MTHFGFILASYLMAAGVVAALVAWVLLDARGLNKRLAELEAQGIRRRSAGGAS